MPSLSSLPLPDPGVPDVRSGFRFLLWLEVRQWRGQLAAAAWGTLHMAAVASFPVAVGIAVQAVVDHSGRRLALAGGLMLVLAVLTALGDTMLHRTAVTNWIGAAARVQQLLARKTVELGSVLTRRVAAGEVVAVSTGDVEKIGWFVEAFARFTSALLATVGVAVALLLYEPALGVLVAAAVPVLAVAVLPLLPAATKRADLQREKAGRATELASDTVAGLRVLRGIGGEELFLDRYRKASQQVRTAAVHSARMWALISAVQVVLPGLLLVGVAWYGARLALDGRISVGELVTVYGAVAFLMFPLQNFEEIAMAWSFSRPSAKRAARVLALSRPTAGSGATAVAPEPAAQADPVDPATAELCDPVTGLRAAAGLFTAVVCGDPDAAGLLADRLGGHSPDAVEGAASALLGGQALDALPLAVARAAVLVQDKDPVLLSGTLAELLDVPSSGAITPAQALNAAQCGDVLDALVQSLAGADADSGDPMRARITERGRSLSGGQRQRLALARSLVADPGVLVLDEPTSAVDAHTEARIADGLKRIRAGRTTVVLTSSPLVLDRADRVVFVDDGTATAAGRHQDLLREHPRYRAVVTRETDAQEGAGAGTPVRHAAAPSLGPALSMEESA
ncbi:ABC-type multidrug transport system, ATPase and permease component [Streptomyces sp. DvalAA-14]|uniref:ABC transporter transmembrane domain-containing protein n=1 Tax=unclassified Streptomyces TaxID=2593676 RepID=UPI00081B0DAC|nr:MULTISPECIES: ABC transporter ATP-binding protein [unclassified Streptomyces]MYS24403.1 ATP-binding cassette domain-containing protein [Streptomyces sp. SID4948]SCE45709.1 ABC-type multidrug transport system, ATPase and permease component [Streptomyces sp. DvalAA-14]